MISIIINLGHTVDKATNATTIVATYNKMWVEAIEITRNNNSDKHCRTISTQYEQQMQTLAS